MQLEEDTWLEIERKIEKIIDNKNLKFIIETIGNISRLKIIIFGKKGEILPQAPISYLTQEQVHEIVNIFGENRPYTLYLDVYELILVIE